MVLKVATEGVVPGEKTDVWEQRSSDEVEQSCARVVRVLERGKLYFGSTMKGRASP